MFLFLLLIFSFNAHGLISDNFTDIGNDGSVTDYVYAFNNSLDGVMVFSFLLGIAIVISAAVFSWSQDFVSSIMMGLFISSFLGFLATLVVSDGVRLLSFERFAFFLTLLILVVIYKKVSDA